MGARLVSSAPSPSCPATEGAQNRSRQGINMKACSALAGYLRGTCGVTCGVTGSVTGSATGVLTGSVPYCRAPCSSFFCRGAHSLKARRTPPPSTRHNSPALLPRRASRDSLNLPRESRGSITRGSTCSGSAWDGLPRRPGGDACLPRTRGSCRRRTSIANRLRPPGCGWQSGPGTSGRAR